MGKSYQIARNDRGANRRSTQTQEDEDEEEDVALGLYPGLSLSLDGLANSIVDIAIPT